MKKYIIVLGSQRSGTTLMAQILGAHPSAIMIDENDGLYDWTDVLFNTNSEFDQELLFERCCRSAMSKYRETNVRYTTNGELRKTIQYVILKAPNLTYRFEEIANSMPAAKIVYMLRDIRSVVSSVMKLDQVPILNNQMKKLLRSANLAKIFQWEYSRLRHDDNEVPPYIKMALVAKIKMSLMTFFVNRNLLVRSVKYEDLVNDPKDMILRILDDLDIPPSEDCLNHQMILRGMGPGLTERSRPVDQRSIGLWKDNLTKHQIEKIWETVGEFMESHYYIR